MYEFDSVSVSTYEAASLAAKLSERSADGWEVVAIVPAGSDITAYVKRTAGGADTDRDTSSDAVLASSAGGESARTGSTSDVVSEPSGWGTAPESSTSGSGASSWGQTSTSDSGWGSNNSASTGWGSGAEPAAATPTSTTPTTPAQPATPSVPAGWYHDPAGRYELRYWDGSAWTEHVSRNGQQYTDPPVA